MSIALVFEVCVMVPQGLPMPLPRPLRGRVSGLGFGLVEVRLGVGEWSEVGLSK